MIEPRISKTATGWRALELHLPGGCEIGSAPGGLAVREAAVVVSFSPGGTYSTR